MTPAKLFFASSSSQNNKTTEEENKEATATSRQIRLSELGAATASPDKIRCTITVINSKENAEDVKSSVMRRSDYIVQTLRNNNTKDYIIDKTLTNKDGVYTLRCDVTVYFCDLVSYQTSVNFLVEKLGSSISVSKPSFHHSEGKLTEVRRQASLNAVYNCRTKALSIAQLLHQCLGAPVLIQETEVSETKGQQQNENEGSDSLQSQLLLYTVSITVKINAVFECRDRVSSRKKHA